MKLRLWYNIIVTAGDTAARRFTVCVGLSYGMWETAKAQMRANGFDPGQVKRDAERVVAVDPSVGDDGMVVARGLIHGTFGVLIAYYKVGPKGRVGESPAEEPQFDEQAFIDALTFESEKVELAPIPDWTYGTPGEGFRPIEAPIGLEKEDMPRGRLAGVA
jgi:hypothetical protein